MNCIWNFCQARILQHQLHLRLLEKYTTVNNIFASAGKRASRVSIVAGVRRVGVAILATVFVFGLSHGFLRVKRMNRRGDQAHRGRHFRYCHSFWALTCFLRVKSVNCHRDQGGQGRHPRNCLRFRALTCSLRVKSVNCHRDQAGRGQHPRHCRRFRAGTSLHGKNAHSDKDERAPPKKDEPHF